MKKRKLNEDQEKLFEFLYLRSFRTCKEPFILSSGDRSNHYFDCKRTTMSGEAVLCIGRLIFEMTKTMNTITAFGGMETGAIPLATAVAAEYRRNKIPMEGFFIRKEPKKHGTENFIEGCVNIGDHVILLEDVTTTGKSLIKAYEKLNEIGVQVLGAITLIDRLNGAVGRFNQFKLQSIFTMKDFID